MPEKVSARGLLEKLGLRSKKPAEVQLEISVATPPGPAATEAPPAQELAPATVTPASSELPDWLSAPAAAESVSAPEPVVPPAMEAPVVEALAVEAPVAPSVELPAPVAPAAEAPVTSPAVEVEKSPEQQAIEQFEEALLAADDALGRLRVGETLDNNQLREAMAAAATANGLIRNLPERYLKVLLASRRLGENRDYTRMNFQEDMGAAIRIFSQAKKG